MSEDASGDLDDVRTPKGNEWADIIEALHGVTNMMTVRKNYQEGHPAIVQADEAAAAGLIRLLERVPEIVIALVDDEFLVCERPMPDLRKRLKPLGDAMVAHRVECIVFQRGTTVDECKLLGRTLGAQKDPSGRLREFADAGLYNILLRYAQIVGDDGTGGSGGRGRFFVPAVLEMLASVESALKENRHIDKLTILALGNNIVSACSSHATLLQQRAWTRTREDEAAHATNVAIMTATMALARGLPHRVCMEATAAALLHDIGHALLPDEVRGIPTPMLDDRTRPMVQNHTFAGACLLLGAGCSPLWVAAALEHHRGVDGAGYPRLDSKAVPHEIVRMISLASYLDRKRTLLDGRADDMESALRSAIALEERYFGRPLVTRYLQRLGYYPPGTTVELSDRQPAIVTRANPADPRRPQVQLLRGAEKGKYIDLRQMNPKEARFERSIVRPIQPPLFVPADAQVADAKADVDAEPVYAEIKARVKKDVLEGIDADLLDIGAMFHGLVSAGGPGAAPPTGLPPARRSDAPPNAFSPPSIPPPLPSNMPAPLPMLEHLAASLQLPPLPSLDRGSGSQPPRNAPSAPAGPIGSAPPPRASALPPRGSAPPPGISLDGVPVRIGHGLVSEPGAAFLLDFVDGARTVRKIILASGMSKGDVLKFMELLASRRIIGFR